MKVRFNVEYSTIYGENLVINVMDQEAIEVVSRHVMKPANDKSWKCDLDVPARA